MSKSKVNLIKNIAYPLMGVVFFVVLWHILALINNYELTLPLPRSTFIALTEVLTQKSFYLAMLNSLLRALISCAVSFFVAIVLSLLSKTFPGFKKGISPIISAMRSMPTLVVVMILLLKTRGTAMPIYVACLVILPASYSSLLVALNSIDKTLIDAARVYNVTKLNLNLRIFLPSIRAGLVETAAASFSLAFKVVVSAEIMASTANSIGIFMVASRQEAQTAQLFAAAIVTIFVCILAEFLLRLPLNLKIRLFAHKSRSIHNVK